MSPGRNPGRGWSNRRPKGKADVHVACKAGRRRGGLRREQGATAVAVVGWREEVAPPAAREIRGESNTRSPCRDRRSVEMAAQRSTGRNWADNRGGRQNGQAHPRHGNERGEREQKRPIQAGLKCRAYKYSPLARTSEPVDTATPDGPSLNKAQGSSRPDRDQEWGPQSQEVPEQESDGSEGTRSAKTVSLCRAGG